MRFCVVILSFSLALALVKCKEISKELQKIYEECGEEIGVDIEEFFKIPPNWDDPKTKCFSACYLKKGACLVDGKIHIEKTKEFAARILPKGATDSIKAGITECAGKANEEKYECDVGAVFDKCMMEIPASP